MTSSCCGARGDLGTGEPDICALYPNRLFRNMSGERFADVSTAAGVGHLQKGQALAFGDVDNDGDQDIVEVMGGFFSGDAFPFVLFENPGSGNAWVTLVLQGTISNRSAIGARIRVTAAQRDGRVRDFSQVVGMGGSMGSQSLQLEIGLGDSTSIEQLEVWWPESKTPQVFHDTPMHRYWKVVEGSEHLVPLERKPFRLGRPSASGPESR